MLKSMTGYSKSDETESGVTAIVEIRSLNGKNLDISCRMPRSLAPKEIEIKDTIRRILARGSVNVNINIEVDGTSSPLTFDMEAASKCFGQLSDLKKNLKIRDSVKIDHLLLFSDHFVAAEEKKDEALLWKLVIKALRNGLRELEKMRKKEGQNMSRDLNKRMKNIHKQVGIVEGLGLERIPAEREKLRQRVAQLFENDEYDEQRLQTEIVLLADKLDISEECVRLHSHIKFFFESLKASEPVGRKLNFMMQEMHREINTIGSKANDAQISQYVVGVKEEIERIREQVQNIE